MKILVTGVAGFIGFFVAKRLLELGHEVIGLDNINDYYDIRLKYGRLNEIGINQYEIKYAKKVQSVKYSDFQFIQLDLEDREALFHIFKKETFDKVCNLAAQAGVRYSIENPYVYINSNIVGFFNILEGCRNYGVKHLVYASSSSVYGNNMKVPFCEDDRVDRPVSLYAATKKSNELMAYTYTNLHCFITTGLRFFTVYGPWGRPDMAPMLFTKAIIEGKPIKVFNNGNLKRDFTYIDDIVSGVISVLEHTQEKRIEASVYNIGCSQPVKLLDFIRVLETALGKKAVMLMESMQEGDVYQTYADITNLEREYGYKPLINLNVGIKKFIDWYTANNIQCLC